MSKLDDVQKKIKEIGLVVNPMNEELWRLQAQEHELLTADFLTKKVLSRLKYKFSYHEDNAKKYILYCSNARLITKELPDEYLPVNDDITIDIHDIEIYILFTSMKVLRNFQKSQDLQVDYSDIDSTIAELDSTLRVLKGIRKANRRQ